MKDTFSGILFVAMILLLAAAPASAAAPANDAFANARELTGSLPITISATNTAATKQPGEPDHAGSQGGASVWYSWTASESQLVVIDTCDGGFDTVLGVYTGDAVDALTEVASNDEACAPGSSVEFTATAGTTYRIAVDGYWDGLAPAQGTFVLTIKAGARPPANDDFAAAQELTGPLPLTAAGTSQRATRQAGEPDHQSSPGGASVWFSWTPTTSARVSIDTCASSFATLLGVYSGATLDGLSSVGLAVWTCEYHGQIEFEATAGTTYWIALDGWHGAAGQFALQIEQVSAPPNDDFADAQVLSGSLPLDVAGTNSGATKQPGEPDHAGNPGGASLWYRWTPSESARVSVQTCGASTDTLLAVYTGDTLDALTPVAANDDECGFASWLAFDAVAGTTYRIAVDGYKNSRGGITHGAVALTIRAAGRPNDFFDDARELTGPLPIRVSDSNAGATQEPREPRHAGGHGDTSVWYRWTPTETAKVTVSTCGSKADTIVGVYTGSALSRVTEVTSDLRGCGQWDRGGLVSFVAHAGTTYRIAVDAIPGGFGDFELTLRAGDPPANDDFDQAQALAHGLPLRVSGTTVDATQEPGEPDHEDVHGGSSIWFSWTAPRSASVTLDDCEGDGPLGTEMTVYTGSELRALERVGGTRDEASTSFCGHYFVNLHHKMTFFAVAGTTYRIVVNSCCIELAQGAVSLAMRPSPANDAFDHAQELSGPLPLRATGSNEDASREAGEPDHLGVPDVTSSRPARSSIWYRWRPSASGRVTIDTCGSAIYAGLAVYTGTRVDALALVPGPRSSCHGNGKMTFSATAGTTYAIAVGTLDSSAGPPQGDVELIIRAAGPAPANDDFAHAESLTGPLPQQVEASDVGATREPGEPEHTGGPGDTSIWYAWTAHTTGPVALDTCGKAVGASLDVYTGSSLRDLTRVAGSPSGCSQLAPVTFTARAGTTYSIAIEGGEGALELLLRTAKRPPNDDFARARVLGGALPISVTGSNVDATHETGEPPDYTGYGAGHSVWYSWTPASSGEVAIETCASAFTSSSRPSTAGHAVVLLGIWTGASVQSLMRVNGVVNECGSQTAITIDAVAGTTYRIAVDGGLDSSGTVRLTIRRTRPPANDDLDHPHVLPVALPIGVNASNVDATKEPGEPDGALISRDPSDPAGASLWYSWTPAISGRVRIGTCGSTYDTLLAVYAGDGPEPTDMVGWSDDNCGDQSRTTFAATAGTTYRILIAGSYSAMGTLELRLDAASAPANDAFAAATPLHGPLPITVRATNLDATAERFEPSHDDWFSARSVWYRWTPDFSGPAVIDTCGTAFSTVVGVYTGDALRSLTPVARRRGDCGGQDRFTLDVTAGTTYRVAIDGYGNGAIELAIRRPRPPRNDRFEDAQQLDGRGLAVQATGSNVDGTRQGGEPRLAGTSTGATIWYRWTPRRSGQVTIDTCGSQIGTALAVFAGSSLVRLERIASASNVTYGDGCEEHSKVVFDAVSGTTYSIGVDGLGYDTIQGEISLSIGCIGRVACPPPPRPARPAVSSRPWDPHAKPGRRVTHPERPGSVSQVRAIEREQRRALREVQATRALEQHLPGPR